MLYCAFGFAVGANSKACGGLEDVIHVSVSFRLGAL